MILTPGEWFMVMGEEHAAADHLDDRFRWQEDHRGGVLVHPEYGIMFMEIGSKLYELFHANYVRRERQ